MTEKLLHFIWQFQYFNRNGLCARSGDTIQVIHAGQLNANQGPDFINAKIRIGKTVWAGNVELHVRSSDWKRHKHQHDKNYKNVILHVVWEDDSPDPASAVHMPVLELTGRVSGILLERYHELIKSGSFIPCEKLIATVKPITWQSWKDRLLAERLQRKSDSVLERLLQNKYHWEETFWWLLARNFGIRINAAAFEEMARSVPVTVLARHKSRLPQLEALLMGQAGLLTGEYKEDEYVQLLKKEYRFLKTKYKLAPIHQPVYFLRMRPGNFPTIRLAQLALLIQQSTHLFSKIRETDVSKKIRELFEVSTTGYWQCHYRFADRSSFRKKKTGTAMIDNIIINTVTPVLFTFGIYHGDEGIQNKALQWLEQAGAENNQITRGFQQLGLELRNACDSQAMIELKNEYCNRKRCLECVVGNAILKN